MEKHTQSSEKRTQLGTKCATFRNIFLSWFAYVCYNYKNSLHVIMLLLEVN